MQGGQVQVNARWRTVSLYRDVSLQDVDEEGAFLPTESPMPVWTQLSISPVGGADLELPARVVMVVEARRAVVPGRDTIPGMRLRFEGGGEPFLRHLSETGAGAKAGEPAAPQAGATKQGASGAEFEALQPVPVAGADSLEYEVLEDSSPDLVASVATARVSRSELEMESRMQRSATGELEVPARTSTHATSQERRQAYPKDKVIIEMGETDAPPSVIVEAELPSVLVAPQDDEDTEE